MLLGRRDRIRAAHHQPRLRTAEQLVAGEAHERGAGAHRAAHGRLVGQHGQVLGEVAGADVVDHRHAELAQLLDLHLLDEAELAEVGRVRAQDRAGAVADGVGVVGAAGAVGGADLDERRAGLRDHVGHAEAAADLDELAARDHDLAARAGERRGGEQHRGGAVVDGERRLGAGQLGEQRLDVVMARTAAPARGVPLERRVALRGAGDRLARRRRERRAAEVRVDDHAGGVEHPPQRRLLGAREPLAGTGDEVGLVRRARAQLGPPLVDDRPGRRHRQRVRRVERRREAVDGGQ